MTMVLLICVAYSQRAIHADSISPPLITAFEHAPLLTEAQRWNAGRLLVGELNCVACHRADDAVLSHLDVKAAPDLSEVGSRLNVEYLKGFLASPHETKPGTTMPDVTYVFHQLGIQPGIEFDNLVHYLMSHQSKTEQKWARGDPKRGRTLYHTVGCVACHAPKDDYTPTIHASNDSDSDNGDAFDEKNDDSAAVELPAIKGKSISLGDPDKKYKLEGLASFLHDPLKVRPGGRMPNMKLSKLEALNIATYLHLKREAGDKQARAQPKPFKVDENKASVGAAIFSRARCFACHTMRNKGEGRIKPAPPLAALTKKTDKGCLAKDPRPAPNYHLSDRQRTAVKAFLAALPGKQATPASRAERTLAALNCIACHQRGEMNGESIGGPEPGRAVYFQPVKELDLGDEGRLPPPLTGIGRKLQRKAFADVLAGTPASTIRPYIATRMPIFGEANVKHLPAGLAAADIPSDEKPIQFDGNQAFARNRYGRELLGKTGMSCITCHNLAGRQSLGIPAIDLASIPHRLRPQWYRDFMIAPTKFRPGVRMPSFFPDGKSVNKTVLRGNVTGQLGAMWRYLKEVDQTRLPIGMEKTDVYVLTPKDEPIVLRTFMKGAGTHAIVVGYPEGLHFAFDSKQVRPALAWRGKFIDAEATWDNRFTPWTVPLGKDVISLSSGPTLAVLKKPSDDWPGDSGANSENKAESKPVAGPKYTFTGFHLNKQRRPIFTYRFGDVKVEESFIPVKHDDGWWLRRQLKLQGNTRNLWFRATGIEFNEADQFELGPKRKNNMLSPVKPDIEHWYSRAANKRWQLLVPIVFVNGKATIELEIKWFKD